MFERYWNFTTCIRSDNLAAIADVMTQLLEQEEGCRRLTQLPEITIDSEQLRYLPAWERPRLWIISLFSGSDGWTIVKTWPNEFLCARVEGATCPRLSALPMELRCDAFHFRVVRDICGILLEADATGHIFLSGWNDYEGANSLDETHVFYEEQIDSTEPISQFYLLKVSQLMQSAMRVYENPEIARIEAEFERLLTEDPKSELLIDLQDEVEKGYADRPRLSALAMQIGCNTFYVGLYEYGGILMEADATGDIFISGSIGEEYLQEGKFFDEPINSEKFEQFFLLDVSEEIHRAKQVLQEEENRRFEQWEEQFLEDYASSNFLPMIPSVLEQWKAQWKTFFKKDEYQLFKEKGGKRLYETLAFEASHLFTESGFEMFEKALAHLLGGTHSYWYLGGDPLVYRAYTQQEQLEADGARLLYFRPTQ